MSSKIENKENRIFYNYILITESGKWSYVGYTVDFNRRFRQHSAEIKGGAKFTVNMVKKGEKWRPLVILVGCPTNTLALQLEYAQKQKMNKSRTKNLDPEIKTNIARSVLHSRLKVLLQVLHMSKWSSSAAQSVCDVPLHIYWPDNIAPIEFVNLLPEHFKDCQRNLNDLIKIVKK